eukprot:243351_1
METLLFEFLAGFSAFALEKYSNLSLWQTVIALALIVIAVGEVIGSVGCMIGRLLSSKKIPHRGKHLDSFDATDIFCVAFSKLSFPVFSYHLMKMMYYQPFGMRISWAVNEVDVVNTIVAVLALFVVYDFFYCIFHRVLHIRGLYKFVHKHHHKQKAPTRGQNDAINVHPFEFLAGEYNHLLALFLVNQFVVPVHVIAVFVFLALGNVLASLNHTRYDVRLSGIYQAKDHDVHHWYPDCNYSQYTMLWDHVFGWYKEFPKGKEGIQYSYDD